jgi:menaquinone-dependent protoporphyrinogen oxidase
VKVLVTAASRHGSTAEIAQAIANALATDGLDAEVIPPQEVASVEEYDAVVLGSAVYTGHWLPAAKRLVARSAVALAERPVWLFSSGPVGDPTRKIVQQMGADPVDLPDVLGKTRAREHRVFAGKLEKRNLAIPQRAALLVMRGLEGDFRDWAAIEGWASEIAQALRTTVAHGAPR